MNQDENEQLSREDEEALAFEEQEQLAERLQAFGARLSEKAEYESRQRSDIEQRWLKDLRQFHGEYSATEKSDLEASGGSTLFVNITRNKTNAAEARLQDMLFPTDDRNWGIKPTPLPQLEQMPFQKAQIPEQVSQKVEEIKREAKRRARIMQDEIDDQLKESCYQIKARDAIHDSAKLGTGIFKGPVINGRQRKKWTQDQTGATVLEIIEALEPSVERVDPWDFFPDSSARTISECEYILERQRMTKRQLRDFASLPGVLQGQLKAVIAAGAKESQLAKDNIDEIRSITGTTSVSGSKLFELWEYHGPISKTELFDAIEGANSAEDYTEEELEELDDEIECVVYFSGKHVLRVVINPMETQERPYSVFNWEKDETSIFGFGIPYLMRNAQKVINASWRMIMDNAGMSVADQIVVNREIVEPADGQWRMGPKKIWYLKDKSQSASNAFATFSTQSHQAELGNIFNMARQLADEETNMPLIAQGEQSANVTKTSSGMAMLMNSANIVLRRAVKNWDDDVTRPLITRFYDFNMQFNKNQEAKGDYTIDARGSGALLVKEKQQETLMVFANIAASNQEFAVRVDWGGMYKEIAKALEVPVDQITLSDAEIQQKQEQAAQQGNPELQMKQAEMQIKQQELQIKQQQVQMEMQLKQQDWQAGVQLKQMQMQQDRELKLADIAARENITVAQLQAQLQLEQSKDKTNREKAAGELAIKRTESQLKAQNLAQGHDTYG